MTLEAVKALFGQLPPYNPSVMTGATAQTPQEELVSNRMRIRAWSMVASQVFLLLVLLQSSCLACFAACCLGFHNQLGSCCQPRTLLHAQASAQPVATVRTADGSQAATIACVKMQGNQFH